MKNTTSNSDQNSLRAFAEQFDRRFADFLTPQKKLPEVLVKAVQYSALSPGKRIRPFLVIRCCELAGGDIESAWASAAAIECVHAFSLVHDDLPAMDNDDLRRGKPTCHKKFDEATAILAGDSLVVLAFELIARHVQDPALTVRMILELAEAAGWSGMIGGQAADIAGEYQSPSLDRVHYIHDRKSACLFAVACRFGAMSAGGSTDTVDTLGRFGQRLGLLFQMADDLLDVSSSPDKLGKPVGQDDEAKKQTYPRCMGIEESRKVLHQALQETLDSLQGYGDEADDLRELARFIVDRNY